MSRACGTRKQGGIYFTIKTSPYGELTWDDFVIDPVWPIPEEYRVSYQGITIVERDALDDDGQPIYDFYDHVGKQYYTLETFYNELHEMGMSRRIPRNMQFDKISDYSRYILVFPDTLSESGNHVNCKLGNVHSDDETCFWQAVADSNGIGRAACMSFPMTMVGKMEVILSDDNDVMKKAIDSVFLAASKLPVEIVSE